MIPNLEYFPRHVFEIIIAKGMTLDFEAKLEGENDV